ncbi:MAG: efflux RND transporter periplasmic adaptor subunit [Desulfovibrio sp.]|uniref:efflux RND transporter periplasmic adaptor subunit n=1 Tax=Desulfovibrio sp. TaxID=885 RepID=UPI0039E3BEA4
MTFSFFSGTSASMPVLRPTFRRWHAYIRAAALLLAVIMTVVAHPAQAAAPGEGQRAQLVAINQAVISSELAGRITSVRFREGERFNKGDVLIAFDSTLFKARFDRAAQAESAAAKKYGVARDLNKLGSISTGDYEQARSGLGVAAAETRVERVMMDRCSITAPFSGRIGETFVRAAEHVSEGTKLLTIYDDSAFEVETIVPSGWLAWLRPGYALTIAVDETGGRYAATVSRIAGVVDPVSQSVKIVALLANEAPVEGQAPLMPGMSGTILIDMPHDNNQESGERP